MTGLKMTILKKASLPACLCALMLWRCADVPDEPCSDTYRYPYDSRTEFCHGNTVVKKCGGSEYDPSEESCYGGTTVYPQKCPDGSEYDPSKNNPCGGGVTHPDTARYKVTFNTNGGTPETIDPVIVDSAGTLGDKYPDNLTKAGYTFEGWFDGSSMRYYATTPIVEDAALIAIWKDTASAVTVKTFIVGFDRNGGTSAAISPVEVDSGTTLGTKFPANPTKAEHTFEGWFDKNSEEYDAMTKIFDDVELFAQWKDTAGVITLPDTTRFTVKFNTDGGTPAIIDSVVVDSGAAMGTKFPANPTKAENTFGGWFDSVSTQYLNTTAIHKNVSLIAKWNAVTPACTKGQDCDDDKVLCTVNDNCSERSRVECKADGGEIVTTCPPTVTEVTVRPSTDTATVVIGYRGDTRQFSATVSWANNPAQTVTWTVNGASEGRTSIDSSGILTISADETAASLTVKATSTVDTSKSGTATVTVRRIFTITFDATGGAVTPPSDTTDADGKLAKLPEPNRTGYNFAGWFTATSGGNLVTEDTEYTASGTIYARWTPLSLYTITFNANYTGGTVTPSSVKTKSDGTLETLPVPNERTAFSFNGWFTTATGGTQILISTVFTRDTTVYARWTQTGTINGGDIKSVLDGSTYPTVMINGKRWLAKNIDFDLSGYTGEDSRCYENIPDNCVKYGRLYNWETANNLCQNILGVGWRLPTDDDWEELVTAAGGASTAGTKLKSEEDWSSNGNGTDDYGFSALPGGYGNGSSFLYAGLYGHWWSATEHGTSNAWYREMYYGHESVDRSNYDKSLLFSLRCVRD